VVFRTVGYMGPNFARSEQSFLLTRNERAEALPFTDAIRVEHGRQDWLPPALRRRPARGCRVSSPFAGRPGTGHYPPPPKIAREQGASIRYTMRDGRRPLDSVSSSLVPAPVNHFLQL
jgi:hypothetical protein